MSTIDLATAKQYLDVIHSSDDAKLQILLDAARDEAQQFINRQLTEICEDGSVPSGAVLGVMLLLQAAYQATPDDAAKLRAAAEVKLTPYRCGWGV